MWPWAHLGLAYVAYLVVRPRAWWRADRLTLGALVVGTQLPDLIDKPLAWVVGVLPSGRSLAHSLVFVLPLLLVVAVVCRRRARREAGFAFGFGVLSHLALDAVGPFLAGDYGELGFLLWPLTPPPYVEPRNLGELIAAALGAQFSRAFAVQLAVGALLGAVFCYHVWRAGHVEGARPDRRRR
ncbi:metal-dependent hydrolase [Halarchaeum salinum]|uniref:Metal-dependent hydrolase n=1 Tax=Halarchaeum salinum TaxID=489912 RepID=A0AAV3S9K2_9EURY